MKATVHRNVMSRALQIASLASSKGFMRDLVLLCVEDEPGWMRVTATSTGTLTAHVWCRVQNDEPGEAVVNLEALRDWVSLMDDPIALRISRGEASLEAKSGRNLAHFRTITISPGFPSPQQGDGAFRFQVDNLETFRKAAIAADNRQDRPILTGLLLRSGSDGTLIIAGSDGYRLSECRIADVGGPVDVVVPCGDRVRSMVDIVSSFEGFSDVTVDILDKSVLIRAGADDIRMQVEITPLDGRFPDYMSILPRSFPTQVTVPTRDFLRACQMANAVSGEYDGTIILRAGRYDGEGELEVASPNRSVTSNMNAVVDGDGRERIVAICGDWLIQGLRLVREPEVSLGVADFPAPLLVSSGNWRYFIMPRQPQ